MTTFFFDTRDGDIHHADEFGSDYADIASAREDAISIAKQLMLDAHLSQRSHITSVTVRADGSEETYMVTLTLLEQGTARLV